MCVADLLGLGKTDIPEAAAAPPAPERTLTDIRSAGSSDQSNAVARTKSAKTGTDALRIDLNFPAEPSDSGSSTLNVPKG